MFLFIIQYSYSSLVEEYNAMVYVKRRDTFHVDSPPDLRGKGMFLFHLIHNKYPQKINTPTQTHNNQNISTLSLCLSVSVSPYFSLSLSVSFCLALSRPPPSLHTFSPNNC